MKSKFVLVFAIASLNGCQLPNRIDIQKDVPIPFDTSTIINSNSGLLADGISGIPGTICVADNETGKCDTHNLVPFQCLHQGSTVEVKAVTDPTPSYHSLITRGYQAKISSPFITIPKTSEYVDEVKASVSAIASIKSSGTEYSGYPGIAGIRACLLQAYGPARYNKVYWISAANVISVTTSRYYKVGDSLAITGTGFGFDGATYNSNTIGTQTIWIGISASVINSVGDVSEPVISGSSAKIVSSTDHTAIIENKALNTQPILESPDQSKLPLQ